MGSWFMAVSLAELFRGSANPVNTLLKILSARGCAWLRLAGLSLRGVPSVSA
jgi:hypothetical protein